MSFTLAHGVSFCEADGQRIFLDLRQDRYFALSEAADASFTRLMAGDRLTEADRDRLVRLEETGFLRSTTTADRPAACASLPAWSAVLDQRKLPAVSPFRSIRATLALSRAKREVGRVPLDRLCDRFTGDKRNAERGDYPADDDVGAQLAVAFQAAARLVGALDQCLAMSLALGRSALAAGLPIDLLFGVRARPFHAHAWVQSDGVVLSDRLDNIRPYTPILVL